MLANFPTVFERSGLMPAGPKHKWAKEDAWLGEKVSGEIDADINPDDDNVSNISPPSNLPDRDGHDDGLLTSPLLPCGATIATYQVKVSNFLGTKARTRFTNVWYDFNQDGDFADTMVCQSGNGGQQLTVHEWAVQNDPSHLGPGTHNLSTPGFAAKGPTGLNKVWMRITLSDAMSPAAGDGRGPPTGYLFGETEDYLVGASGPAPFLSPPTDWINWTRLGPEKILHAWPR